MVIVFLVIVFAVGLVMMGGWLLDKNKVARATAGYAHDVGLVVDRR